MIECRHGTRYRKLVGCEHSVGWFYRGSPPIHAQPIHSGQRARKVVLAAMRGFVFTHDA